MRIRSIKPEFWRSPDVTSLPLAHRFLFIGLWSYVDDNGVGKDEMASVIGDLFAEDMLRDSRETVARVSEGLSLLSERGLIRRYSVDSRAYLFIVKWEKHQRIDKPAKPRFPRPDGDLPVDESPFATPSRQSRDTLATGTGEQGNRGTEEQRNRGTESAARKRATRLSPDWKPSTESIQKIQSDAPHVDARTEHATFVDYWIAQPGQKGVKTDWDATWRNWMRRKESDYGTRGGRKPTRTEENLAVVAQYAAMESQQGEINA